MRKTILMVTALLCLVIFSTAGLIALVSRFDILKASLPLLILEGVRLFWFGAIPF